MNKKSQILSYIRMNPYVSQQELAEQVGLSRSAVANYITRLTKEGEIKGRAYILNETASVVCIGGANVDRKARTAGEVRLYTSNPVHTLETAGGVARNVAENLRLLGLQSVLMACVGEDREGTWLLHETQLHGVDVSQVWRIPTARTGTFTTLLDHHGKSIVSMADMHIYEHLTADMLEEKWTAITGAKAVFLDTNLPAASIRYLIERCHSEKIPVYLDAVSPEKAKKLPVRLDGIELIVATKEEAEVLTESEISSQKDYEKACRVIRKLGAEKIILMQENGMISYMAEDINGVVEPIRTDVLDVTGTKDALAACTIYGLMQGESLEKACQLGIAGAALTQQTAHSNSTLLTTKKLNGLVEEYFSETN